MTQEYKTLLIAALLSSGLFLAVSGLGLGFLFMFLPTLPLFSAGLNNKSGTQSYLTLAAGSAAVIPIMLLAGTGAGAFFFFLFVLPSAYICHAALMSRDVFLRDKEKSIQFRLWFPMGLAMVHIALYGCTLLALLTGFYALQETNLPQLMAHEIHAQLAELQKIYDVPTGISIGQLSFMICAFMVWIWGIALWLHAWLACRALVKKSIAQRQNLSITPFPMPNWLLTLMGISALASLIGSESMAFLGKSCLIILLLPYFFQGMALLHTASRSWPNRVLILVFIYLFTLTLFWPAFLMVGAGLLHHLKILNKHLHTDGTSSRH